MVFLPLSDTLGDPFDVTNLLFLQLEVGVKDPVVELLLEGELAKPHLLLVEEILKSLASVLSVTSVVVQLPPLGVMVQSSADVVSVGGLSQELDTIGVQVTEVAVQPRSVIGGQLGVEGVDGDGDGPAVSLELKDISHNLLSLTTLVLAIAVEVLQVGLVEGVTDDLNVQLAQVPLGRDTLLEVGGKGGLDHEPLVTILNGGVDSQRGHTLESSKRVSLLDKLLGGAIVHGPRDEEDSVIDHVRVAKVVQKVGEGDNGSVLDVVELNGHPLSALFDDNRGLQRVGGISKEIPISGSGKMKLHIFQLLALHQVVVIRLVQKSPTEPASKGLKVPITDVEVEAGPRGHSVQEGP